MGRRNERGLGAGMAVPLSLSFPNVFIGNLVEDYSKVTADKKDSR
jgi:hypothetical protein